MDEIRAAIFILPDTAVTSVLSLTLDPSRRHSGARANASPESITTTGRIDSGPAPYGASRNDGMNRQSRKTRTCDPLRRVVRLL